MKKLMFMMACALLLAGCANTEEKTEQESIDAGEMQVEELVNLEEESEVDNGEEDSGILWEEKYLHIPELQNEYEVWFLADSHIIIPDDTASDEVKAYAAERQPVFANDLGMDSSEIFTQFIGQANSEQPDLILFGGDILDFPSDANVTFLREELGRLKVPYLFVMGNHDWTYPWEYMTPEGAEKYRPMLESITGMDSYAGLVEWKDIVFLAVDNSSNQVAQEAVPVIEQAYATGKPIVLVQHVPFSSEKLIARAKEDWANPVTLGMQVHGGIPVNAVSDALYKNVLSDESQIRLVLAGHVHFSYEEQIAGRTTEIITDAAFKGRALKVYLSKE